MYAIESLGIKSGCLETIAKMALTLGKTGTFQMTFEGMPDGTITLYKNSYQFDNGPIKPYKPTKDPEFIIRNGLAHHFGYDEQRFYAPSQSYEFYKDGVFYCKVSGSQLRNPSYWQGEEY